MNHKLTERAARKLITERHRELYDKLLYATRDCPMPIWPRIPTFELVDDTYRACGQYSSELNRCKYSVPYCVYLGDEYWETIAHELAHAFAHFMSPGCPSHGSLFLNVASLSGLDTSVPAKVIGHFYDVRAVDQVAQELREMRGSIGNDVRMGTMREGLSAKLARVARERSKS